MGVLLPSWPGLSAIHGLRVDPAEVVDASLRRHNGDHAPKSRFQRRLV
jgi:hypothetical protein